MFTGDSPSMLCILIFYIGCEIHCSGGVISAHSTTVFISNRIRIFLYRFVGTVQPHLSLGFKFYSRFEKKVIEKLLKNLIR